MNKGIKLDFLLGAVSPMGFTGYFNQVLGNNYKNSVLIKAGPGCGKSTLMKKVADYLSEKDNDVQLIHCSSDPDSLDGVICSEKDFAIVDATAPHTLEPLYPVASEKILSFYDYINPDIIGKSRNEVTALFKVCGVLQERAARYITAAGALLADSSRSASACTEFAKVNDFTARVCAKNIPRTDGIGTEEIRLVSATTCKGQMFYLDTILKLSAKKLVVLDDEYGSAAKAILKQLRDDALAKGHKIITCYCPMSPYEKIEHLFIPALGLGFATSNSFHQISGDGIRVIHCKRFMNEDLLKLRKSRMKFNKKAAAELLLQASSLQAEAKQNHDKLEEYYKEAVDFNGIDSLYKKLISTL